MRLNKKGMTLTELMVVVVIVGLLCVSVLPILYNNRNNSSLRSAAYALSGHINHCVSKSIGSSTGYGVFLDNDSDKNMITNLNFCSGMMNTTGSAQLTTMSGTDSNAVLNPPIPVAILGKLYDEFPVGTLISFVGHPYEYQLNNDGSSCSFRSDSNQNCYNCTFPFNSSDSDNPYYYWILSVPPRRLKFSKSIMSGNTCVDLGFSTIGVYGYSNSNVETPYPPLIVTFDNTGRAYTAIYNNGTINKQIKIGNGTPIAFLVGFRDQVGESWVAEPTEDNPGWNLQRRDTFWVVLDPEKSKTFIVENCVKSYNSEPPINIAIQDAQTFVRQSLKE